MKVGIILYAISVRGHDVFKQSCLVMEPAGRLTCEELLDHSYFDDDFKEKFEPELEVYKSNKYMLYCRYYVPYEDLFLLGFYFY